MIFQFVKSFFQTSALHKERCFSLLERFLVDGLIQKGVSQPYLSQLELVKAQLYALDGPSAFLLPLFVHAGEPLAEVGFFVLGKFQALEFVDDGFLDGRFREYARRAGLTVAAVVDITFLYFTDQGAVAGSAGKQLAKNEVVAVGLSVPLAVHDVLDFLEDGRGDDGLMDTGESFPGTFNLDNSDVERVLENSFQGLVGNLAAHAVAQAKVIHPLGQLLEVKGAGGIKLKSFLDQWCLNGVWQFDLAGTLADISRSCRHGKQTLLEPAVNAFSGFFFQIADVVRCHHGLDVGREAAASGS